MNSLVFPVITGSVFILTLVFGFWLMAAGRPYSVALSTVHKLLALLAGVLMGVIIFHLQKAVKLGSLETAWIIITCLLFLITFITGTILLASKESNPILLVSHKVVPILTALSIAITVYLIVKS